MATKFFGSTSGLTIASSAGMAYITSNYNTGIMPSDIKGAWLSDTDTTSVSGAELFSSPTPDTGWTDNGDGTYTCDGSTGFLTVPAALVASATYQTAVTIDSITSGSIFTPYPGSGGISASTVGSFPGSFTTTSNGNLYVYSAGFAGTISAVSTVEVEPDRSVNGNHLTVNGTLTKTPVAAGAELVAYSGFSATNYLSEAYNADYDFGTGDFCVMGWIKGTSTYDTLIHRAISSGGLFIRTGNAGKIEVFMDAGTTFSLKLTSVSVVNDGAWHLVAVRRLTGILSIYIDGVFDSNVGTITDITYASATLRIGNRIDAGDEAENLALLRIGATAPSAAQILKMYNDELPLFQPNAAATLYGASDAVTALAHDPITDRLHVGTSAGRSVFNGLEREYNTTDAVTTTIDVSGGLVAEK